MTAEPNNHDKYGPSTLNYREVCAGWIKDPHADMTRAEEGTKLHKAVETGSNEGLDAEQIEQVEKCRAVLRQFSQGAEKVQQEVRVTIKGVTFGTTDVKIIRRTKAGKRRLTVIDWKMGYEAVADAEKNKQGWSYVIGALAQESGIDELEVIFVSPRRDEIDRAVFALHQVPAMHNTLKAIVNRAKEYERTQDPSILNPTDLVCSRCGRLGLCAKTNSFGVAAAKSYAPLELVENFHSSEVTDPKAMGRLYTIGQVLEKMAGSIKEHAKQMVAEHGDIIDEIAGVRYAASSRAGARSIPNHKIADAVDTFLELGLTERDLLACSSLALGKALDLIESRAYKGQKAKARGAAEALLAERDCIEEKPGTTMLKKVKISGLLSDAAE